MADIRENWQWSVRLSIFLIPGGHQGRFILVETPLVACTSFLRPSPQSAHGCKGSMIDKVQHNAPANSSIIALDYVHSSAS